MSEQFENNNVELEQPAEENSSETPSSRYNQSGQRRGKHRGALFVGFLVSALSIVGVIAIVMSVIGFVQKQMDDSALREEIYYYLEPLLLYSPEPFDNAADAEQDAFLSAAAYRVLLAENIRMLREGAEYPQYPVDEERWAIAVPVEEIEASYDALFGKKAPLTHRSIEGTSLEYSEADNCYYVPFSAERVSGSVVVIDTIKKSSSSYEVRVGFVPVTDIQYDEHGQSIPPTADLATHFQIYTLTRDGDGYFIKACQNE